MAQWVFVARDQLSRRLSIMVVEDGARGGAEGGCLGAGQPTRILFPRTGCFVDVDDTGQPSAKFA